MSDPILCVPVGTATAEVRVRGSRFVGVARPAASLPEAVSARERERTLHHDASHHVFACRLADGAFRFDDDGEPAGTGGRAVLAAIDAAGLSNVVVVVIRYFGGTKLGTGGLARAYGGVAAATLAEAPTQRVTPGARVRVRYRYEDTGSVARVVGAMGAVRIADDFGQSAELLVALARSKVAALGRDLRQATAGTVEIEVCPEEMLLPVDT